MTPRTVSLNSSLLWLESEDLGPTAMVLVQSCIVSTGVLAPDMKCSKDSEKAATALSL
jgi:uncharacterized membrane protein